MVRSFAIVGAGVSGLACAMQLGASAGCTVTLLEKARGVSGRLSTRRVSLPPQDDGASSSSSSSGARMITFDHGAQYFTARSAPFSLHVDGMVGKGHVKLWDGKMVAYSGESNSFTPCKGDTKRYVGVPKNNSLGKHMMAEVEEMGHATLKIQTRVDSMSRAEDGKAWTLTSPEGNDLGTYDHVVIAIPSHQALDLIPKDEECASSLREAAESVPMEPTWALMVAFESHIPVPFDGAFLNGREGLSWIARDSSKPGRTTDLDCWVAHANPSWTRDHIDCSREEAATLLMEAFRKAVLPHHIPSTTKVVHSAAHRWLYANFDRMDPFESHHLMSTDGTLSCCGDWCGGSRVEGAFLSGYHLGRSLGSRL